MGTPQPTTTVTSFNPNNTTTVSTYQTTSPTSSTLVNSYTVPSYVSTSPESYSSLSGSGISTLPQTPIDTWFDNTNWNDMYGTGGGSSTGSGSSSGGGGGSSDPPPPPPPPAPILPTFTKFTDDRYTIKVAPRDTIVFDQDQDSIQLIQELLYEELGGVELANMSRTDLIDGQQVSYSAIANLLQINKMYNSNNIVSAGTSDQSNFSIYSIDLLSRGIEVPEFDDDGNIIIRVDDLNSEELIEYQIALNGTIDRVDSI